MIELNFTAIVFSISFLVFLGLMNMIFFSPVSAVIEERDASLNADKDKSEQIQEDYKNSISDYEKNLAKAKAQSAKVLEEAQEAANKEKEALMNQTLSEINEAKALEYSNLEKEKDAIFKELRTPIKEVTSLLVSKVLNQNTEVSISDDQIHSQLNSKMKKEELAV